MPPSTTWYHDKAVKDQLRKAAQQDHRSLSSEITYLLQLGLQVRQARRERETITLGFDE
jgi:hypothetical protein